MKRVRPGVRLVSVPRSLSLSRRELLRDAGLLGLGFMAASCGEGQAAMPSAGPGARPTAQPGTRPVPTAPEGTDILSHIDHIIVLMMENHSFDSYFGMLDPSVGFQLQGGRPTAANYDYKRRIAAFHMPSACQSESEPSQAWNASHIAYAGGRNDGFVRASGPVAMGYWTGDDIPFYYGLARTFPLASRWFSSTLCQTYPNRRFLMAGTAAGIISTTAASLAAPAPPNGNIFERLDAHGISWANYHSDVPSVGILLDYSLQHLENLLSIDQFFTDAASGNLPSFCIVDPSFNGGGSEENPDDIRIGEQLASQVINAAMSGPGWKKTLLVWLYDEHGGYYDHVPPPSAVAPDDIPPDLGPRDLPGGYDRYGFRVPAVIVSPYAKPGYVSTVVRDHTAILKLVERKWNLGALTYRDAAADDLLDCLDFDNPPAFLEPPVLPAPALAASNPAACTPGVSGVGTPRVPRYSSVGGPLAEVWGRRRAALTPRRP